MKKVKTIKDDVLEKELDIYRKYYEVDDEEKVIKMVLHYKNASELLEEDISTIEKPQIKRSILERIAELVKNVPEPYRVDVALEIKDYEQYRSEALMEAVRDAVEFSRIGSEKKIKRNWVTASIFSLIGVLILVLSVFLGVNEWFSSNNGEVFKEVLNIAAWVFIWEAVTILFVTPNEERSVERTLRFRLRNLSFRKVNVENDLCEEESSYLLDLTNISKHNIKEKGRYLLLISGFLMIVTGTLSIFFMIAAISNVMAGNGTEELQNLLGNLSSEGTTWILVLITIVSALLMAWRIIGGIAGVDKFAGKGKMQKLVPVYAITMLIYHTVNFVVLSFGGQNVMIGSWFSSTFGLILNLVYAAGYYMDRIK